MRLGHLRERRRLGDARSRDTFSGWDWSTPANGGNKSMELRNAAISNDNGQNWAPSTAAAGATPGAANSVRNGNVPPIIHDVKHSPAVPKSAEQRDDFVPADGRNAAPGFLTATLFWRDATTATPGAFQSRPMAGDGAGRFSAMLGPLANLTIVEFYISATRRREHAHVAGADERRAERELPVSGEQRGARSERDAITGWSSPAAENAAFDCSVEPAEQRPAVQSSR